MWEPIGVTLTGGGAFIALAAVIGWLLNAERRVQARADEQVARAEARVDEHLLRYREAQHLLDQCREQRRAAEDEVATLRRELADLRAERACRWPEPNPDGNPNDRGPV